MSEARSIRVAFAVSPGDWLGGRNYQRSLFSALCMLPGTPITPVLFTGQLQEDLTADFPGVEIVQTPILDRGSPAWVVRKVIARLTSQDILLRRLLKRHGISIVSHSIHLGFDPGRRSEVKTIGWIPDLQHVRMPEFFSPEARLERDRSYRSICERCDKIVVSSECARAELCSFAPEYAHKMEILRFVANPTTVAKRKSLGELQELYDFKVPYFLLPNQFWEHKNHRVVIFALEKLKRLNKPCLVLATGSTKDWRNPELFSSLMDIAAQCGVLDYFRVLGQIPYDHLDALMRHAVAVINPSRFEGWSTSVEEAKARGKQVVLSDLPVHREQAPKRAFYFPAEDAEALAWAMRSAYDNFDEGHDAAMQNAARANFPERQRAVGETYRQIVTRALGNPRSKR